MVSVCILTCVSNVRPRTRCFYYVLIYVLLFVLGVVCFAIYTGVCEYFLSVLQSDDPMRMGYGNLVCAEQGETTSQFMKYS